MKLPLALVLAALAASSASAGETGKHPIGELRARLERLGASVAGGCNVFDGRPGGAPEATPIPQASDSTQLQSAPPPPVAKPSYKEVAPPGRPGELRRTQNPLERFLEGTRNLAHKARETLQAVLDGTRNL